MIVEPDVGYNTGISAVPGLEELVEGSDVFVMIGKRVNGPVHMDAPFDGGRQEVNPGALYEVTQKVPHLEVWFKIRKRKVGEEVDTIGFCLDCNLTPKRDYFSLASALRRSSGVSMP